MSALTLAQLTTAETQEVIETRLLAALAGRGLPVDAWMPPEEGGVERTSIRMVAGALAKLASGKLAEAARGRFLDLATDDLLTFLAKRYYQLDRQPATSTLQSIWISLVRTAPPIDFQAAEVWVASSSTGHRYQSLEPIALGPQDSAAFLFQAEQPGAAYNDPAFTIDTMVTAPAGVSCINAPATDYLPAHLSGFSSGHITARSNNEDHNGDPLHVPGPIYETITVRIDADGDVGAALFRYSLDGGNTWLPDAGATVMPPTFTILGPPGDELLGAELFFMNGGASPSFIHGDIFTLVQATAIEQQGGDAWSDATLRKLCRDRWATISDVPTAGAFELWAHLASPEVRKVLVDADPNTPGSTLVTIASGVGPATGTAQLAVTDFIEARLTGGYQGISAPISGIAGSPAEAVLVRSAVASPITAAGTVMVPRGKLKDAQTAAQLAWLQYLASVDLGGVVILAELEQALLDAGATTYKDIVLNGVNRNVQLAANEVAVAAPGSTLITSLKWVPV